MADETDITLNDITLNDIAVVIEDGRKNKSLSWEIARAIVKLINDKWYYSRKDVGEDIIGDIPGMNEEEWKEYHRLINIGWSIEEAENAVRGRREPEDGIM